MIARFDSALARRCNEGLRDGHVNLPFGTAGYAMTFGVASMPEGVTLEWNGQPWTGSCENSSTLVPDNPVPGPAGVGLAGVMMLAGVRRRRQ